MNTSQFLLLCTLTGFTSSSGSTNPFDSQGQDEFAAVFGAKQSTVQGHEGLGDILLPTVPGGGLPPAQVESGMSREQSGTDLHSSLQRVAKSLGENIQCTQYKSVDQLRLFGECQLNKL